MRIAAVMHGRRGRGSGAMMVHAAVTHGGMAHTGPGSAVHSAGSGTAVMTAMHAAGTRASAHAASAAAAAVMMSSRTGHNNSSVR